MAAQESQTLPDAEETEAAFDPAHHAEAGGVEPDARIGHGERQRVLLMGERHHRLRHLGVLDGVEQEFAHGLVQEHGEVLGEGRQRGRGRAQAYREVMLLPHPPGQPLQGRKQAALLQGRRAELPGERACLGEGLREEGDHLLTALLDLRVAGPPQHVRPDARRYQELLQAVVKHIGQAAALPLFGQGQLRREGPKLPRLLFESLDCLGQLGGPFSHPPFQHIVGLPEGFLRMLAGGDVARVQIHVAGLRNRCDEKRIDAVSTLKVNGSLRRHRQRITDGIGPRIRSAIARRASPLAQQHRAGHVRIENDAVVIQTKDRVWILGRESREASNLLIGPLALRDVTDDGLHSPPALPVDRRRHLLDGYLLAAQAAMPEGADRHCLALHDLPDAGGSEGAVVGALWRGALFGLIAYATYDLTNLSTLAVPWSCAAAAAP